MKEKIRIEPKKVVNEWNEVVTAYYYDFEITSIVGCQGDDITDTGAAKGYNPETMTDKDCKELAKTLHTIENRGAQHPLREPWTQEIWVFKSYYDEEGELLAACDITAHGEYTADGYDGRD